MADEKEILTVSEITRRIKFSLEKGFPRLWVQGEISNFKRHTSGHLYFTLKDESSQISGIMWRSRAVELAFLPEDGMSVLVRGSITVYPPRGNYQIEADQLQPIGVGALQLAFEQMKRKLSAEGLFDEAHKKPIPQYPESIGIITSETGAVIQDIFSVLSRRMPSLTAIVYPVRVQGVGAAQEIATAIRDMNEFGNIDVLIVARGGGSLEDLWAFNEELVARAIYASKIPVISAVGHEIDFSIADFVADLRAPTPSAAAELVVRDRGELLEFLANLSYTMRENLENRVSVLQEHVHHAVMSYSFNRPKDMVRESAQRIDELDRSLTLRFSHLFQLVHQRQQAADRRLEALSPKAVLKRGYTMVRTHGSLVTSSRALKGGDEATIQFHDGDVTTTVEPKQ